MSSLSLDRADVGAAIPRSNAAAVLDGARRSIGHLMGRLTRAGIVHRLLEATRGHAGDRVVHVPLDAIVRGEHQARADEGDVEALADSVERDGLLQPITLRPLPAHEIERRGHGDARYEIIAGHRRFAAYQALARRGGHARPTAIPAIVRRDVSDVEAVLLRAVENAQRLDLSAIERAWEIATIGAMLEEAGEPATDRQIGGLIRLSHGPVSEYRLIGRTITPAVLIEAGLVELAPGDAGAPPRISWPRVRRLLKEDLVRAARLASAPERARALAESACDRDDRSPVTETRRETVSHEAAGNGGAACAITSPETRSPSRRRQIGYQELMERGGFTKKLSSPFGRLTMLQAQQHLNDLLPAVAALAERGAPEQPGIVAPAGPGFVLYARRPSTPQEAAQLRALLDDACSALARVIPAEAAAASEVPRGTGAR